MKLQAKLKLRLKRQNSTFVIRYNTFEKATYDQYLVASIIKHTKQLNTVERYVNQITGKGSLNKHFMNLYNELVKLDKDAINKILESSMYPILKVDKSNRYTYYPDLGISIMNKKIYKEKLSENEMLPQLLVPEGVFHDSDVIEGTIIKSPDTFNVDFNNDKIKITLKDNIEVDISEELFKEIVELTITSIPEYNGTIHEEIAGKDWRIMTKSKYNDLVSNDKRNFFYNDNHFFITNKYVKKTRVALVFGMYLYKETYINYNKRNRKECTFVIEHLEESGLIDTMKMSGLIAIIKSLSDNQMQVYLNYLLDRKDSSELSTIVFSLMRRSITKGWSEGVIESIFKHKKIDQDLLLVYKITPNLNFELNDLLRIYNLNRQLLNSEDIVTVEKHMKDKESIINELNSLVGSITNEAGREMSKELRNLKEVKLYKKLTNKLQAHVKRPISKFTLEELKSYQEDMLEFQRVDILVKKLIEDNSKGNRGD